MGMRAGVKLIVLYLVPLVVMAGAGYMWYMLVSFMPGTNVIEWVHGGAESSQWGPWAKGNMDDLVTDGMINFAEIPASYFSNTADDPLPPSADTYVTRTGTVVAAMYVMPVKVIRRWRNAPGPSADVEVMVIQNGKAQPRSMRIAGYTALIFVPLLALWYLWAKVMDRFAFKRHKRAEA